MVKKAAGYLARNGPVSPQDRWEEDPGYTPFTVAAEIAALLAAAELADLNHEASLANHLREIADVWNDSVERWMYMSATDWCKKFKVEDYYVRIAPKTTGADGQSRQQNIQVKNVTASEDTRQASHLISPDALALVRFGLRAADDPRIRDTAKVIDALLKVETPNGAIWHRYNDDGYGEREDREAIAKKLLSAMESFANESGFISEQVWDSPDIAARELYFGRPSGSAMPLVWAHAEYLKLRRSLRDGRIFDQPPQTVQRYLKDKTVSPRLTWRFNHKLRSLPPGKILRIELMAPAVIRWTADDWQTCQEIKTLDDGLGIHLADLQTKALPEGTQIKFTFYGPNADRWEGKDFMVRIATWQREEAVSAERKGKNGK
jgi:glucoamylase